MSTKCKQRFYCCVINTERANVKIYFSLTSLDFSTGPSLGCLFPSYCHQPSSATQASPVQSKAKWREKPSLHYNVVHISFFLSFSLTKAINITRKLLEKCIDAILQGQTGLGGQFKIKPYGSTTNFLAIFGRQIEFKSTITCLCLISSFFCSRKAEGIPAMLSWALSSRGHRSLMNSRAFFPFRKPVRLICIILLSGCCNTHTNGEERGPYSH